MKIILLIMIGLSAFLSADFTKVGNVVTDSKTGLVWQDDAVGPETSWQGGIDECEVLTLDGFDDWRLPNINELKSIIDRSKKEPFIVDGFELAYVGTNSFYSYWSSTSVVGFEDGAWRVDFDDGYVGRNPKDDLDDNLYVRCVRDGQ